MILRMSSLFVRTLRDDPADAEVVLDGVPQGACRDFDGAPRGLEIGAGAHRVEIRKSGFWPAVTYVEPDGTRAAMTITLQKQGAEP